MAKLEVFPVITKYAQAVFKNAAFFVSHFL